MKNVFDFLSKLSKNNNKEWFTKNKPTYEAIVKENKLFFNQIYLELQKHDQLSKAHVFRIYNDVRFSKDKSPYKKYLGAGFARLKPFLRGGYYIHIEPNNSFVGGGFWAPNTQDLFRIRKEFEAGTTEIKKITTNKKFVKYFGTLQGEDAVKIAPKGFDKNDAAIHLIKKKQFVVKRPFTNEEVLSANFEKEVIATFKAMRSFFNYMSDVLTTNLNGESVVYLSQK